MAKTKKWVIKDENGNEWTSTGKEDALLAIGALIVLAFFFLLGALDFNLSRTVTWANFLSVWASGLSFYAFALFVILSRISEKFNWKRRPERIPLAVFGILAFLSLAGAIGVVISWF